MVVKFYALMWKDGFRMLFGLTLPQILGILGVPSVASVIGWVAKKIKDHHKKVEEAQEKHDKEIKVLKLGMQAMLRAQMISEYNKFHEDKGYAPIWAKDNFENIWSQYEALGENGVMNDIHDKFMALPTERPKRTENK